VGGSLRFTIVADHDDDEENEAKGSDSRVHAEYTQTHDANTQYFIHSPTYLRAGISDGWEL
jgi:hypothetical protein